jgi:hypothetical protein
MWRSHSALAVFLIGTVVCGCAEQKVDVEDTEEQKNQQILATYSHLTKFFDDCVERSARRRLASSSDVGAAIEQGFGACKAEESAIVERLDVGVKPGFGQQQIGPYKFRLKQRLLQVLAAKEPVGAEKRRGNTATVRFDRDSRPAAGCPCAPPAASAGAGEFHVGILRMSIALPRRCLHREDDRAAFHPFARKMASAI